MPRKEGMERADLLSANGAIFTAQGKAISAAASPDVRILVVGNPANTNALIALNNAANTPDRQFTAMTRLDHNRAIAQLAAKAGAAVSDVTRMTIWGNHSATQYPDVFHAEVAGKPGFDAVGGDQAWLEGEFIPTVQQRGAAIIKARGLSSAASAANAAVDHMRVVGASAPPRATGCRWPCRPTAATACPRAWCRASRAPARAASTRSCRASSSTTSAGPASTPRSPSWPPSETRSRTSA